jgi:hypothetical protein
VRVSTDRDRSPISVAICSLRSGGELLSVSTGYDLNSCGLLAGLFWDALVAHFSVEQGRCQPKESMAGTRVVRETSSGLPVYRHTWSPFNPLKSSEHGLIYRGFSRMEPRSSAASDGTQKGTRVILGDARCCGDLGGGRRL